MLTWQSDYTIMLHFEGRVNLQPDKQIASVLIFVSGIFIFFFQETRWINANLLKGKACFHSLRHHHLPILGLRNELCWALRPEIECTNVKLADGQHFYGKARKLSQWKKLPLQPTSGVAHRILKESIPWVYNRKKTKQNTTHNSFQNTSLENDNISGTASAIWGKGAPWVTGGIWRSQITELPAFKKALSVVVIFCLPFWN